MRALRVAVLTVLLAAAGCGSSLGLRTAATPAAKLAAYYRCMAAQGFPDYRMPTPAKGSTWGAAKVDLTADQEAAIKSPRFPAADQKCGPLLPGFGSGLASAREAAARAQARKFSRCARAHGLPDFPDPDSTGAIDLGAAGVDPESPAFLQAKQACRSLIRLFSFLVQPPG